MTCLHSACQVVDNIGFMINETKGQGCERRAISSPALRPTVSAPSDKDFPVKAIDLHLYRNRT